MHNGRRLGQAPKMFSSMPVRQYHLATDASKTGLGGVLYQIIDLKEHIIMFLSYQLTEAQGQWHTTEREAFAVYKCLEECNWVIHI